VMPPLERMPVTRPLLPLLCGPPPGPSAPAWLLRPSIWMIHFLKGVSGSSVAPNVKSVSLVLLAGSHGGRERPCGVFMKMYRAGSPPAGWARAWTERSRSGVAAVACRSCRRDNRGSLASMVVGPFYGSRGRTKRKLSLVASAVMSEGRLPPRSSASSAARRAQASPSSSSRAIA
jgi:hypothetical protein